MDKYIYHVIRPCLFSEQEFWKNNWNFATDVQIHEQFVTYNIGQTPVVYTDTTIILFNSAGVAAV
jgi:hypothetical protein